MKKHRSRGQSLVETALVLASFMALLLGMVGIGETLFVRQTLASRAHQAARWGAVHPYDPAAIRNLVLFGTATPGLGGSPFMGLAASEVEVANSGCPGAGCRISVAIPGQGIRSVEPAGARY